MVRRRYYCFFPIQQKGGGDSSDPLARVLGQTSVHCSRYWVLAEAFLKIDGHDRRARSLNMQRTAVGKTLWNDTTVGRLTAPSCIHPPPQTYIAAQPALSLYLYLYPARVSFTRSPYGAVDLSDRVRDVLPGRPTQIDKDFLPRSTTPPPIPTTRRAMEIPTTTPNAIIPQDRRTTTRRPLAERRRHENFC